MAHFRRHPGLLDRVVAAVGPEDGAYVRDLAVFPGWQGRGIGSLLLRHCARRTREVGLGRIFLNCSSFNEGARQFYERQGFRWVLDQVGVILPQYSELLMMKQLVSEL
jgi:ribosomal protein S18 acetylase RimI-like enzyme